MSKTVLVIEHNHDLRVKLRFKLEEIGYEVYSAGNAVEGLDLLRLLKKPDLIILSLFLPIMSGDDFLKKKIEDPELASIPIFILTAPSEDLISTSKVDELVERIKKLVN